MLVEITKFKNEEVPVVTSLDVAETFNKEHKYVLRDIRELECSENFRQSNFGQSIYVNTQNHEMPMYYMTRDGFTLLAMGYTGEKAMKFKEAYINQFNAMEKALRGKIEERAKGIAVRQALTNAIKISNENERMHGHAYSNYTNIIYKALYNKSAKQLKIEYGISANDNLRDHLPPEELSKVKSLEFIASGLIECGYSYEELKVLLMKPAQRIVSITTPEGMMVN